ncbi:MAG: FAD-dependent oxidoreductase [Candidatus Pacebacteria bacterium]|nr:FAD-dependent oxidoreductase [Candidatus Paceibacterota bacterium]
MTEGPALPILILGAGLSGLRTAVLLKREGFAVKVLEARDRIGGRVYTKKIGNVHVELGGEWIGMKDFGMRAICKEYGLQLIPHQLNMHLMYEGKHYRPEEWTANTGWEKELQELVRRFPELTPEEVQRLQNIDWWHFLGQHHVSVRDMNILDLIRSTDFGEDMRFVPAYDVLYDYAVGGDGEEACSHTIQGGNKRLPEAMLEELGEENLVLNAEVTEVRQKPDEVSVMCKDGTSYTGQAIVAAIPTLAVTNITWSPGIPQAQMDAFNEVTYARILKTAVSFEKAFWNDDEFEIVTDLLPQQIYHATPGQTDGAALIAYTVGDRAQVMSSLPDSAKEIEMQKVLQATLGDHVPTASEVTSYYWGADPYTGGAYPWFERDDRTKLQPLLRMSSGRVHFSGEHTAKRYGFMEGAIESGERVAEEVITSLKSGKSQ